MVVVGAAVLTIGPGAGRASAHSVGAYPTQLLFTNSLRGASYQQTIGILDDSAAADAYNLSVTGAIATWASFREASDPAKVITTAEAHAGPPTQILLQVDVPVQAANAIYQGVVHLTPSVQGSAEGSQNAQGVGIAAVIPVGVQVTGAQEIAGSLLDAYSYPAIEVGSPLRLFTVLINSGNVEVHPSIDVVVTRDGTTMFQKVFDGEPVDPGAGSRTIESDWTDTSAAPTGQYAAHVDVKYMNTEIGARNVSFRVVPYGSLRRSGTLDALRIEQWCTTPARSRPGRCSTVSSISTACSCKGSTPSPF